MRNGEAILRVEFHIRFWSSFILASLILTACSSQPVHPSSTPVPTQEMAVPSPESSSDPSAAPTNNSGSSKELLSSIPNHEIFLYGEENGVTLRIGDEAREFDWIYMTPTGVLPRLQVEDYDGDGRQELSVILYIGSGTGISVEELHMINIDPADPEYFQDHVFKNYDAQLDEAVQFKTIQQNDVLFGQISIDSTSDSVSLKDYQSPEFGKVGDHLVFGNIVRFDHENKQLEAQFGAEIILEKSAIPQSIGHVDAHVSYKDGKFALSHFAFQKDEAP